MIANKRKMKLRLAGMKTSLRIPDDLNTSLTVGKHSLKPACVSVYFTTVVVLKTKHSKTMNEAPNRSKTKHSQLENEASQVENKAPSGIVH